MNRLWSQVCLPEGLKEHAQEKQESYENTTENICRAPESLHGIFEGVPHLRADKAE